mmetsp:Transcript_37432/g.82107  ORF Transcript_37432/g.82107 Transcript_37432/m.82107 type:complete len:144 (-) Transcript_37432:681-1112(-)
MADVTASAFLWQCSQQRNGRISTAVSRGLPPLGGEQAFSKGQLPVKTLGAIGCEASGPAWWCSYVDVVLLVTVAAGSGATVRISHAQCGRILSKCDVAYNGRGATFGTLNATVPFASSGHTLNRASSGKQRRRARIREGQLSL